MNNSVWREPSSCTSKRPRLGKKSLGQHFLVNQRVVRTIVNSADISHEDIVLEIGPGKGALTKFLAEKSKRLVTVEIDENLANRLREIYSDDPRVSVLVGDARQIDIRSVMPRGESYKVVANLPYYAASPIIRRFLEADLRPSLIVATVQREVAHEMVAVPGKMGLLSVAIQLYGHPSIVASIPPRDFRPIPKVTSSIIRIEVYSEPLINFDSDRDFFRIVKAGFSAPRKQLHNCLSNSFELPSTTTKEILFKVHIDPKRRAQTLSLIEWGQLYSAFKSFELTSKLST